MANNPNVNKVVYGDQTVMDITDTTAEPESVLEGEVFYDRSGTRQTGSAVIPDISNCYQTTDTAETAIADNDYFPFYDTSATAKRKTLWSNIKAKLNEIFFRRSEANILGAKNLLPLTTTGSSGDIWTVMEDGTVVANGMPSANTQFSIVIPEGLSGNFLFSGCPNGGTGATYDVYPWDSTTGARPKKWDGTTACESDYGGTSQEIQIPSGHRVSINCRVYGNYTANNLVFKPMLRLATDTDDTFEPFAMTNKELTDRTLDVENQLATTVTEEELRDTVGWTCKNLIALPPVGTIQEINGITFTVLSDGGVSVVGTSTASASFFLATEKLYAGEYTSSCIFDGAPDGQYPVFSQILYAQDGTLKQLDYMTVTNTNPAEKTKSIEGTDYLGNIVIYVAPGKTVNQILYPMIRKASVKDSTFEPYHGTVDEVKADKSSLASFYSTDDTAGTSLDNADNFPFYDASDTAKKNITWNIIKSLMKSGISTDSVVDNSTDLITSGGVYNALSHVVGTVATVSAGQSVRIPASGTDDRITTNITRVYIPFADSDDGKPVKFSNMSVYNGYLTITVAQALSAQYIGVIIVNTLG